MASWHDLKRVLLFAQVGNPATVATFFGRERTNGSSAVNHSARVSIWKGLAPQA
jgi:hypothetical protein